MSYPTPFSEQLRRALAACPLSRYRIAQEARVNQSTLSLFVARKRGLSMQSIDALVELLGLELKPRKPITRRRGSRG